MADNYQVYEVDSEAPRAGIIPIEYGLGWRTSNQYYSISTNSSIYWNDFETNTPTIKKNETSTEFKEIKLLAGNSYKISGELCGYYDTSSDTYYRYRWYNVTKGEWCGGEGGFYANYQYFSGGSGPAIAYVALEEDSIFELRFTYVGYSSIYYSPGTSLNIETIGNMSVQKPSTS